MYGFVSGVFLCGLRATRLTEKNAFGFESSSARFCVDERIHRRIVLAVADAGADHDRVERGGVLRAIDQRPHLGHVTEPHDLLSHHAADLQRVSVHAVVQKQDPGHEGVTVGSKGRTEF